MQWQYTGMLVVWHWYGSVVFVLVSTVQRRLWREADATGWQFAHVQGLWCRSIYVSVAKVCFLEGEKSSGSTSVELQ